MVDAQGLIAMDFNPHLPRGRRPVCSFYHFRCGAFQPTPPSREATKRKRQCFTWPQFQPTPPSREATKYVICPRANGNISTHTSLAGGDRAWNRLRLHYSADFNPHLPRGRRQSPSDISLCANGFQPTPPSREATISQLYGFAPINDFNPHLPRGRRPCRRLTNATSTTISTHTSLAGGDIFTSTMIPYGMISTHTSLAGGDTGNLWPVLNQIQFQPTPPSREATYETANRNREFEISTHTSLAGGDSDFPSVMSCITISTHTSLAGGDMGRCRFFLLWPYFNPHLPRGRRLDGALIHLQYDYDFNPHLPRGRRHL